MEQGPGYPAESGTRRLKPALVRFLSLSLRQGFQKLKAPKTDTFVISQYAPTPFRSKRDVKQPIVDDFTHQNDSSIYSDYINRWVPHDPASLGRSSSLSRRSPGQLVGARRDPPGSRQAAERAQRLPQRRVSGVWGSSPMADTRLALSRRTGWVQKTRISTISRIVLLNRPAIGAATQGRSRYGRPGFPPLPRPPLRTTAVRVPTARKVMEGESGQFFFAVQQLREGMPHIRQIGPGMTHSAGSGRDDASDGPAGGDHAL